MYFAHQKSPFWRFLKNLKIKDFEIFSKIASRKLFLRRSCAKNFFRARRSFDRARRKFAFCDFKNRFLVASAIKKLKFSLFSDFFSFLIAEGAKFGFLPDFCGFSDFLKNRSKMADFEEVFDLFWLRRRGRVQLEPYGGDLENLAEVQAGTTCIFGSGPKWDESFYEEMALLGHIVAMGQSTGPKMIKMDILTAQKCSFLG